MFKQITSPGAPWAELCPKDIKKKCSMKKALKIKSEGYPWDPWVTLQPRPYFIFFPSTDPHSSPFPPPPIPRSPHPCHPHVRCQIVAEVAISRKFQIFQKKKRKTCFLFWLVFRVQGHENRVWDPRKIKVRQIVSSGERF